MSNSLSSFVVSFDSLDLMIALRFLAFSVT